mmetsp:Transcript_2138/g.8274  ORF Transcript_2138/g.8274 Transcript_2138/m.8274 type:complete len:222 (-) Transcript_2138:54-719(-)
MAYEPARLAKSTPAHRLVSTRHSIAAPSSSGAARTTSTPSSSVASAGSNAAVAESIASDDERSERRMRPRAPSKMDATSASRAGSTAPGSAAARRVVGRRPASIEPSSPAWSPHAAASRGTIFFATRVTTDCTSTSFFRRSCCSIMRAAHSRSRSSALDSLESGSPAPPPPTPGLDAPPPNRADGGCAENAATVTAPTTRSRRGCGSHVVRRGMIFCARRP